MQPLQLQADLQELLVLGSPAGDLFQPGVLLQRRVKVDLRSLGHELRDGIRLVVGEVQHPRHVADDGARFQRPEGDDLPDLVLAVLARDVGDDLVAAAVAEVDVEVGHGDALGVEEALEEQAVLQGIDVGDLQAVGHQGARPRAAAGPHRDALFLRVVDEVPDDEEVAREAHRRDDGKLVVQALRRVGRHRGKAFGKTAAGKLRQVALRRVPLRDLVDGELGAQGGQLQRAGLRDPDRVRDSLRQVGEDPRHLVAGLEVELGVRELHPRAFGDLLAGSDADEDVLRAGVLLVGVMDVVGGGNGDARLAGDLHDLSVDDGLLGDPVVLHLQVEAVRAEQLPVVQRPRPRLGVLPVEDCRGDVPGEAGAQGDQPVVVARQRLVVDAGLVVEALGVPQGAEGDEVLVAGEVAGKEHQVMAPGALLRPGLVQAGPRRLVDLGPDDGRDALLAALLVEGKGAEHVAVIGQGEGGHAEALRLGHERVDGGGAVEEGEIGMAMQMRERRHVSTPLPVVKDNRAAALCKYGNRRATLAPEKSVDRRKVWRCTRGGNGPARS